MTSGAGKTGTFDDQTQKLSISVANLDINSFTDKELKDPLNGITWAGTAYDKNNVSSGNELITNVVANSVGNTASPL